MNHHARRLRGFTLVELMIVVVIIGVLSVLAVVSFKKYSDRAKRNEAIQFLGAVRVSQEAYYQAFGQYCGTPNADVWPAADEPPFTQKLQWGSPPADTPWGMLGVKSPGQTWFLYHLHAGLSNGDIAANAPVLAGSRADGPWFWARAEGNLDGDNQHIWLEVSSERPNVFEEQPDD